MKWLKKHKEKIVDGVKFYVLLHTMVFGFWFTYIWLWWLIGLPIEWWSIAITTGLSILSTFGFCQWCTRG